MEDEVEDREEKEEVDEEDGEEEEEDSPGPRPLLSLLPAAPQGPLASPALACSRMSSVAVRYFSSSEQCRLAGRFCWPQPPLDLPFQELSICTGQTHGRTQTITKMAAKSKKQQHNRSDVEADYGHFTQRPS